MTPPTWQEVKELSITFTLEAVLLITAGVLLAGLFTPKVDNNKIFEVLGPLLGLITGYLIADRKKDAT